MGIPDIPAPQLIIGILATTVTILSPSLILNLLRSEYSKLATGPILVE